jgi:dihydroneopterin triphosphate diphosphatase
MQTIKAPKPPKLPWSVLVVVHTPDHHVLLIRRADVMTPPRPPSAAHRAGLKAHKLPAGYWQSVTGSVDAIDEPFADTAHREVWEETGIDSRARGHVLSDWRIEQHYDIYPSFRHRYAPGITRNAEHVFGLQVPHGTPVRLNPREHTHHVWLPADQAMQWCGSASNALALDWLRRGWR